MSKTTKKNKNSTIFKHLTNVEVTVPEFEPLAALNSLDVTRLSRGNHKIEVGFLKGGCCGNLVRAVIRRGMVMDLEVEPCKETVESSPELIGLVEEARRQIKPDREQKFQPISVADFMRAPARQVGGTMRCFTICFYGMCIRCCGDVIAGGGTIVVCGSVVRDPRF